MQYATMGTSNVWGVQVFLPEKEMIRSSHPKGLGKLSPLCRLHAWPGPFPFAGHFLMVLRAEDFGSGFKVWGSGLRFKLWSLGMRFTVSGP